MATIPGNDYGCSPRRPTNQTSRRAPRAVQQTKRSILRTPARTQLENKPKDIQIRFGQHPYRNNMYYNTPSYLRRRKLDDLELDPFTDPMYDWEQPNDLQPYHMRTMSSPIRTPPRLRALMSSPGLKLYHNSLNLRRAYSPLPGIDWNEHPVNLDNWGLSPHDYRMNPTLSMSRPQPSPLTQYGLHSNVSRHKKSYIVVPSLSNLMSPQIIPNPTYSLGFPSNPTYIPRIHSFSAPDFAENPSDYVHDYPQNTSTIMDEVRRESRSRSRNSKQNLEHHYENLHRRLNEMPANENHLFSDDWLDEVNEQTRSDTSSRRVSNRSKYHDLSKDAQKRLLAEISQDLIDYEVGSMARELSDQLFQERMAHIRSLTNRQPPPVPKRRGHNPFDQKQTAAIDEAVDNNLLDALQMNNLIAKYLRQNGSKVNLNDLSRLLDGTMLDTLVDRYQAVDGDRTIDNYATKKFHMNTFMNATMDLLLKELSASLIKDMKDLDEQQRKFF